MQVDNEYFVIQATEDTNTYFTTSQTISLKLITTLDTFLSDMSLQD
jgi:hypothetical protein